MAMKMKKTISILVIILLCAISGLGGVTLAIGSGAMLALVGLGATETPLEDTAQTAGETDVDGNGAPLSEQDRRGKMPVMPFPEIIVNVTDTSAQGRQSSRFLKLNMLMVYDDQLEGADRLVAREVYLRDTFQDFLRQLHVNDLKGSHGLAMMKTELLRRARAVGHTEAPVEILIADMVVQ